MKPIKHLSGLVSERRRDAPCFMTVLQHQGVLSGVAKQIVVARAAVQRVLVVAATEPIFPAPALDRDFSSTV